jgi:hypothetical protein
VAVVKKKRAIIYMLFPKLNTANVKLYFKRYLFVTEVCS